MSGERPILLVDDDASLRAMLVEQLSVDGAFAVFEATTLKAAEAMLNARDQRYDALILGASLPDGAGRDLSARLRQQGHRLPIILLTEAGDAGAGEAHDADAGVSDHVAKPFRLADLLTRLRTQLRLVENSEDISFVIGPYLFRPSARLLQEQGGPGRIRLTEKEVAILQFLYRSGADWVARQMLLNEVWGYNEAVTTHTLETHMYRLRQKIEADPANPRLLLTVAGGYRLEPTAVAIASASLGPDDTQHL
jgi:DNA-binding response OmpR family regulator